MGLLKMILGNSKEEEEKEKAVVESLNTEETILLVMENLGFLDAYTTEKLLDSKSKKYDKSVFYRLRINGDISEYQSLKAHLPATSLGYGSLKLKEFRTTMEKIKFEKKEAGANSIEIEEELIFFARMEITRYANLLKKFNESIQILDENSKLSEADRLAMIDYWTSYYKEEKFGYPMNADVKIKELVNYLKKLEYGGYGDKELAEFETKCQEQVNSSKNTDENINQVLKKIEETIFEPLKSKYLTDLTVLKRRISLVSDSSELEENIKQQKIEEFILDFNERNGHIIDVGEELQRMKRNLSLLQYGGYSAKTIDEFLDTAQDIIIAGKSQNQSNKSILAAIKVKYKNYLEEYNKLLEDLEKKMKEVKTKVEKDFLIEEFKEQMGHPINFKVRFEQMAKILRSHLSEEEVSSFAEQAKEIVGKAEKEKLSEKELMTKVKELYNVFLDNKQNKTDNAKQIENYCLELSRMGYNEKTIDSFKKECFKISSDSTLTEKANQLINQKFMYLKLEHINNERIFSLWKKERVKKYQENPKKIEVEIKFLLSLSPEDLANHYKKDMDEKKKSIEKHNMYLKIKYLAQEEATKKQDDTIYNQRLEDWERGITNYSEEELERAEESLKEQEALGVITDASEKLIDTIGWINSTIFKQITDAYLDYELMDESN